MNVYDFDGTIYRGDSSVDFYVYCLKRFPWIIVCLPYQLGMIALYKLNLCTKETEKSAFFSFLNMVPDVETVVVSFWNRYIRKIAVWYGKQQRDDDVIISASPDFLLVPAGQILGVQSVIASEVDCQTGRFLRKNCHGMEKVTMFRALYPEAHVSAFYSDSESDEPMARIAENAYMVKKYNKIVKWKLV